MRLSKCVRLCGALASALVTSGAAVAQIKIPGQPFMQLQSAVERVQQTTEQVGQKVEQATGKTEDVGRDVQLVKQKADDVGRDVQLVKQKADDVGRDVQLVKQATDVVDQKVGGIRSAIENPQTTAGGVILITQSKALKGNVSPGDDPGFPVTISRPGSYALAENLRVDDADADAVELTTDHVTLDLNGFAIFGPAFGSGEGIATPPGVGGNSTIVLNGIVRDMGSNGIRLDSKCRIENVQALFNGGDGINVTSGALILNTIANDNVGDGIQTGTDSSVVRSKAAVNGVGGTGGNGVVVSSRSLVTDSVISRNDGFGIAGPAVFGYARNVLGNNNSGDANPQVSGGIEMDTNLCGTDTMCP